MYYVSVPTCIRLCRKVVCMSLFQDYYSYYHSCCVWNQVPLFHTYLLDEWNWVHFLCTVHLLVSAHVMFRCHSLTDELRGLREDVVRREGGREREVERLQSLLQEANTVRETL